MRIDKGRAGERDEHRHADQQHHDKQNRHDDHVRDLLVGRDLVGNVVRLAPSDAGVAPHIDRLAQEHQEAAECHAAVDVAHRQVEQGHALVVLALGGRSGNECDEAEKGELDEIDESQHGRACRARFHHVREQLDRDMGVAPGDHGAADEHDPHQTVARDLLGPGQAVIENIAREELQEDDEGERPEDDEGDPVFRIVLDGHRRIFDLDQALLVLERLLFAHWYPRATSRRSRRTAARRDLCGSNYFSACSASYSAFDQPAPALASLCNGTAALRNASRSTSTTVLPSLRNSSASLSSDARIWSVDRALASFSTSSKTFLSASDSLGQTWPPTMVTRDSVMWPVSMMCD